LPTPTYALPSQPRHQDYSCLGNLDRISAIEVAGRRLDAGWGNSSSIAVLYALIAAGVLILAVNGWQLRRISLLTAAIYAFLAATCIFAGFAYF
jgi:hypothetical protein